MSLWLIELNASPQNSLIFSFLKAASPLFICNLGEQHFHVCITLTREVGVTCPFLHPPCFPPMCHQPLKPSVDSLLNDSQVHPPFISSSAGIPLVCTNITSLLGDNSIFLIQFPQIIQRDFSFLMQS